MLHQRTRERVEGRVADPTRAHFTLPRLLSAVLVERETYFLSRLIFRDHGLETVPVDCDEEGVREESLVAAIREHEPKFLYVIPTHHNPTARTTSEARRRRIVEVCTAEGCPVVSDDVYQLLSFPGADPPTPVREVEKQLRGEGTAEGERADLPPPVVISLGSFSKIWAPATRLGWVQGTEEDPAPPLSLPHPARVQGLNPPRRSAPQHHCPAHPRRRQHQWRRCDTLTQTRTPAARPTPYPSLPPRIAPRRPRP